MATTSIEYQETVEVVPTRWRPVATFVLSLVALGVSAYLTYLHYWGGSSPALCSKGGVVNCTKVLTSSQSMIFGVIPVAVAGLAYWVVVTAVNSPWGWRSTWARMPLVRLGLLAAGMGMVLYLVSAEFAIGSLCEYCTSVHVLTFATFVIVASGWYDMQAHVAAAAANNEFASTSAQDARIYPAAGKIGQSGEVVYVPPPTNGFAIASLVLGIIGGSLLALIFGYVALAQIRRSYGTQGGRGIALAGVVLGWIGIVVIAAAIILVAVGGVSGQSQPQPVG